MKKSYLKQFQNHSQYENIRNDLDIPNVSYCTQEKEVHYNSNKTLIVYYDIKATGYNPIFTNYDNSVKSIEIDGNEVIKQFGSGGVFSYQFDTIGEHMVKFKFKNSNEVGDNAPLFYNLPNIKKIIIPDGFITISSNAFNMCQAESITIGNKITTISFSAFMGCTTVNVPNSVETIGNAAFSGVSHLIYNAPVALTSSLGGGYQTLVVGESVPSIDNYICQGNSNLTSVSINCPSTGYYAFTRCGNLTNVTLGNNVTTISNGTFNGCYNITSIVIPDSVTNIGTDSFHGCNKLASITFSKNITNIGYGAFNGCQSLTSITLPNSLITIEGSAFFGCSSLVSITIPENVTSMEGDIVQQCVKLESFICKPIIPPTITQNTFSDSNNCQIYVPAQSLEQYKSAWTYVDPSRFQAIQEE